MSKRAEGPNDFEMTEGYSQVKATFEMAGGYSEMAGGYSGFKQ